MYKLLNGFLPNIMNEIRMVHNELHDHFTKQFHFLNARNGNNQISTHNFNNTCPQMWDSLQKRFNVLIPSEKKTLHQSLFPLSYSRI